MDDRSDIAEPLEIPPEPSAPPQTLDHVIDKPGSFVGHARIIGAITFVSRILGLAREMMFAAYFGPGAITDAFNWAFTLPNLFRKLLGEGALSAAFIPLYARSVLRTQRGEDNGEHHSDFAAATVTLQILALIVITLIGEAALGCTLWLRTTLTSETQLAFKLAAVMLPYVVIVCAAALLGGILQVHRRFIATTATAVMLNALMIVALLVAGTTHNLSTEVGQRAAIWWVSWSVIVAGVPQVLLLVPSLLKCGLKLRPKLHFWTPAVRQVLRMTIPVAMGLGVLQLGVLLDKQISWFCSPQNTGETVGHFFGLSFRLPMESGALTRLNWAQYLYQFPLGVFGIAIATAIFPQLSDDALDEAGMGNFRQVLSRGIRSALFIGLPASVGMILIALPATRLLFEHRRFNFHDSILMARSTAIYSSVIWAFSVQQILNRAYYALHDMRTPLIWAAVNLIINLLVELPLLWTRLGESGMAVGTLVSFFIQTTVMTALLARRVGMPLTDLWPEGSKMLLATIGMAIACAPVRWMVRWPNSTLGNGLALAATMAVGGVTYFAICVVLRLPMDSLLPKRFQRRRLDGVTP